MQNKKYVRKLSWNVDYRCGPAEPTVHVYLWDNRQSLLGHGTKQLLPGPSNIQKS